VRKLTLKTCNFIDIINTAILRTLGGSTSPHPCDFVDINNATIPTALGDSITASPLIVIVILRQQLADLNYLYIINYGRADQGALDKS
jgi:hypothetical protein